jgi:glycosyltransferase involved in cell wall biosynthesis
MVRHIGYVEAAERQALYEGARLLVQPSFDEGFGITVLEAMSLGIPVVAANRGSLPEVLGGAGVLVDPDDPEDIAKGIRSILFDDAVPSRCASQGLERARAFNWADTAHRVYDTYVQATKRRAQMTRRR